MNEFRISAAELAAGQIFIKSDCWEQPDGTWTWEVVHPPSGWRATGTGLTHIDCLRQINKRMAEEATANGVDVNEDAGETIFRSWKGNQMVGIGRIAKPRDR